MVSYGKLREDFLVQPGTGKALPVYKGEVCRVLQEEGKQCVDTLCYNLHDYRENMETSIMRRQGFMLQKGHFLISDSPRNRLMMQILDKTDTCAVNVIGHRCSAAWFEAAWGVTEHTNCQDIMAEAIGEYGLTPDDTHAALCPWGPAKWDSDGKYAWQDNRAVKKGDHLDLLALMDVLFVNNTCGTSDYTGLGCYWIRPIRIQIFEPSVETNSLVEKVFREFPPLKTQWMPKDFRVKRGKDADYELKQVPGYEPKFTNIPLKVETLEIELPEEDYKEVQEQVRLGLRDDDEDAVRTAVMEWYLMNRTRRHPILVGLL